MSLSKEKRNELIEKAKQSLIYWQGVNKFLCGGIALNTDDGKTYSSFDLSLKMETAQDDIDFYSNDWNFEQDNA